MSLHSRQRKLRNVLRRVNTWHIQRTREIEWLEENEQKEEMGLGRYVCAKIRKYFTGHLKYLDFILRWQTYQSVLN